MSLHVVWDWNGTLLDDLGAVVESVNAGLSELGVGPIDADVYRTHYTRPVKAFYDALLGRDVTPQEWIRIDEVFHRIYAELAGEMSLADDAIEAMEAISASGAGQSLLSMAPHDHLVEAVAARGIEAYFREIRGSAGVRGAVKATHLEAHLDVLGVRGSSVVVIGDTPDDAVAATHVGAGAVLYDGGSHHRVDLVGAGCPVASTLIEAVSTALRHQPRADHPR